MTTFDYYSFRIKNVSDKITEEITFYENCEYVGVPPLNKYLVYLKCRLGIDKQEMTTMMHYDGAGNKCEIKKMNLDEYAKDMDIYMFKRPWNKLREFHKIMKIKEYVDTLKFGKNADKQDIIRNKEFLKKEICDGIKNKKFGKNKSEVTYDEEKMVITAISSLDFNKKNGIYDIDWDS